MLKRRWFAPPCKNIWVSNIHGLAKTSPDTSIKEFVNLTPNAICSMKKAMFSIIIGITAVFILNSIDKVEFLFFKKLCFCLFCLGWLVYLPDLPINANYQ